MTDGLSRAKFALMTMMFRFGQSQRFLGLIFWTVTLTLLAWPYVQPVFVDWGLVAVEEVGKGLVLLWISAILSALTLGTLIDRVHLWREDAHVMAKRNPYVEKAMFPKEIKVYEKINIPLMRGILTVMETEMARGLPDDIDRERFIEAHDELKDGLEAAVRWASQGHMDDD